MWGANSFGSFYWGQTFPEIIPVIPPVPTPPEFEEQLGILVRHRCGTPVFAGESNSLCGVPAFTVKSETRRASGGIGVTTAHRCTVPSLNVTTTKITQRSTRWPTSTTRR